MGSFQGNTSYFWLESRQKEPIALKQEGELIWPIKKVGRQRLTVIGERKPYEPAMITCEGQCSSKGVAWTVHNCITHASYECGSCGKVRRWGFDIRRFGSWAENE